MKSRIDMLERKVEASFKKIRDEFKEDLGNMQRTVAELESKFTKLSEQYKTEIRDTFNIAVTKINERLDLLNDERIKLRDDTRDTLKQFDSLYKQTLADYKAGLVEVQKQVVALKYNVDSLNTKLARIM